MIRFWLLSSRHWAFLFLRKAPFKKVHTIERVMKDISNPRDRITGGFRKFDILIVIFKG